MPPQHAAIRRACRTTPVRYRCPPAWRDRWLQENRWSIRPHSCTGAIPRTNWILTCKQWFLGANTSWNRPAEVTMNIRTYLLQMSLSCRWAYLPSCGWIASEARGIVDFPALLKLLARPKQDGSPPMADIIKGLHTNF